MKFALVCVGFYSILNFISAYDTFNAQSHQQAKNGSNIYNPASHLYGLVYQQQAHSHNDDIAHQHVDIINKKSNRLFQQTRSRLQRGKYQPQDHLRNTTQGNSMVNNQDIHPRFRPWVQTRTNRRTKLTLSTISTAVSNSNILSIHNNQPHLADEKASLIHLFTAKPQTQRHISFIDYYFHQKLKAFFEHQHEKFPSSTRSNIKLGLR